DQVAVAEVTVDDRLGRARRARLRQPPQAQLEGGMGLAQAVEQAPQLFEGITPGQAGNLDRRYAVDRGEHATALFGQEGTDPGPFLVAQDPTRDRLAVDEFHDHEGGTDPLGPVAGRDDAGHGDLSTRRGLEESSLEAQSRYRRPGWITAQDQPRHPAVGPPHGEAPRLAGRTDAHSGDLLDLLRLPERGADDGAERCGEVGAHARRLTTGPHPCRRVGGSAYASIPKTSTCTSWAPSPTSTSPCTSTPM